MAVPVLAASAFLAYAGALTTAAMPKPTGIGAGSTCVVRINFEHPSASAPTGITPPASGGTWTLVGTGTTCVHGDGTSSLQHVWEYRAGASETSSLPATTWTFTWTNACERTGTANRITGASTAGAIFDSPISAAAAGATGTSSPAVSLTTPDVDRLLLWFATGYLGATTWTQPATFTEIQEAANLTSAWKAQAAAGATGSITGSNVNADRKNAFLGGIGPPAAAVAGPPILVMAPPR